MQPLRNRLLLAVATTLVATGAARAQAPVERPATHTVKRGDTLWELAKLYLGDAMQWPQIFRLNSEKIKDPHWIYPGQVLRIPGGTQQAAAPAGTGGGRGAPAARRSDMTVFNPAMYQTGNKSRESLVLAARRTAVRPGDFESAPFMWAEGGPADGGRLEASMEPSGFPMTRELRPIQVMEETYLTLPRGAPAVTGSRFLVYRAAETVLGAGQVMVPTGIVRVTKVLADGRAQASLVKKFEDVFSGQRVMPLDTLAMPLGVGPSRVEFGLATRVAWVYTSPILAGTGVALVLNATSADGLVPGDQVTLKRARPAPAGDGAPDEDIGVAQIVRVTPWGASAMLLDARDAGIAAGVRAQVTAKMP